MKQFGLLLCFALFLGTIFAQPVQPQYGCHFSHQKSSATPWTAEKEAALLASNQRSDTFDILHYRIFTDISDYASGELSGYTEIKMVAKLDNQNQISLDLLGLTVDSVSGPNGEILNYQHQGIYLSVELAQVMMSGDSSSVNVWYHGKPIQSASNFGGVYFDANYIYNLSIGLNDDPHNFGHAWFPCFDNFRERSTYEMSFLTTHPYRAYTVGEFQDEFPIGPDKYLRSYKMEQPLATYQVSFAAANYAPIAYEHPSIYGNELPMFLLSKPSDTTKLKTAFLPYLGKAVDCFESWYGPYAWDKVGYAMTTRGAMENPGNTIYPVFLIDAANIETHLSIMSHELAHNWWGNVVTVGSESDMWIKEGPAEYGAHQFFRWLRGEEAYKDVLKGNTYTVLKTAHVDDGAFLPLSPMPHAVTYGVHTYNKGAMVMHNLHSYLGDSLYAKGMRHLQQAFRYKSMNAYEMRDSLSAFTGYDLTNFYEDWVFSPGFSDVEIEDIQYNPGPNGHVNATVTVQQKVRKAPHLHKGVPVEVNFRNKTGEKAAYSMVLPEEFGTATFDIPFQPELAYLNGSQTLNMACITSEKVQKATGSQSTGSTGFSMSIKAVPAGDSALTWTEHHWTAPDVTPNLPASVRISENHYWNIKGIWPNGFVTGALFRYLKSNENAELDKDLLGTTVEDSLLLLWRAKPGEEWIAYPKFSILYLGSHSDGSGYIRVDTLLQGEYTFATGSFGNSVKTIAPQSEALQIDVMPNPSAGELQITAENLPAESVSLELYTLWGSLLRSEQTQTPDGQLWLDWNISTYPAGTYLIRIGAENGATLGVRKVEKLR